MLAENQKISNKEVQQEALRLFFARAYPMILSFRSELVCWRGQVASVLEFANILSLTLRRTKQYLESSIYGIQSYKPLFKLEGGL